MPDLQCGEIGTNVLWGVLTECVTDEDSGGAVVLTTEVTPHLNVYSTMLEQKHSVRNTTC